MVSVGVVNPVYQRPPKEWYPRLTGVPVQKTDHGTFLLGGHEYQDGRLLVAFYGDVPSDQIDRDLKLCATDEIDDSGDGYTYEVALHDPDLAFPALDAYNDFPEIRMASLVEAYDRGTVSPNPPALGPIAVTATAQESVNWPGDVNGDYQVTLSDAMTALRLAIGLTQVSPLAAARADVNRNGHVDIGDVILTLHLITGKGLPPPYGYAAN